jgi:hypothetical protein
LNNNPTIKPPPFINIEGLAKKLEHNTDSMFNSISRGIRRTFTQSLNPFSTITSNTPTLPPTQLKKGGLSLKLPFGKKTPAEKPVTNVADKAPLPARISKFSPLNEATRTATGQYIDSIKGALQVKINAMNFSNSIKMRFEADANNLRTTLLYCVIDLFDKSFYMFLNKLFEKDILEERPKPPPEPNAVSAKIPIKDLIVNDVIYRMFLLKMIADINDEKNKVNEEILHKYVTMVSDINSDDIDELSNLPSLKATVDATISGSFSDTSAEEMASNAARNRNNYKGINSKLIKKNTHDIALALQMKSKQGGSGRANAVVSHRGTKKRGRKGILYRKSKRAKEQSRMRERSMILTRKTHKRHYSRFTRKK